jgi:hypothetical protein
MGASDSKSLPDLDTSHDDGQDASLKAQVHGKKSDASKHTATHPQSMRLSHQKYNKAHDREGVENGGMVSKSLDGRREVVFMISS